MSLSRAARVHVATCAMARDDDVVTIDPLNVESSWAALAQPRTPAGQFFERNHADVPRVRPETWRLHVCGFSRDITLSYPQLAARPSVEMDVVLECAGNGRSFFAPAVEGTPWRERAVGCARFRGTRLADIVAEAGVPPDTVEILFRGADEGVPRFERSLPREVALAPDTLLAWEMDGEPLRAEHGAPVRLVVPSWYGVASVKWLVEVRALAQPFRGHFQAQSYVYRRSARHLRATPVREKRVNSLVVAPAPGIEVVAGRRFTASGWAWSGHASIVRVVVSIDGGRTWEEAELDAPPSSRHAWRGWHHAFVPSEGEVIILARAQDEAGNVQPERAAWNVHGYGYNAPRPRVVHAVLRQLA